MTNAKQAKPSGTKVTIGGKAYTFKYGMGLIRKIEEISGLNAWNFNWVNPSPQSVHAVVWATMCLQDGKDYTAEEIDAKYPIFEQDTIAKALVEMMSEAVAEKKKIDAGKEPKQAPKKKATNKK